MRCAKFEKNCNARLTGWSGARFSSKGYVQNHHEEEPTHDAESPCVAALAVAGLRDQLLHPHIEHGSGGKGKKPWHQWLDGAYRQHGEQRKYGLHDAREGAEQK